MKFLFSRFHVWIFTLFIVLFVVMLAGQPSWSYHLESDTRGFYYPRFEYFVNNFSFGDYQGNEYFPGAMFFFLIPGVLFLFFENNYSVYLTGLFLVNIILVAAHVFIYQRKSKFSVYSFLLLLLFSGPLFLFRHDFFVTLFVLFSILSFNFQKRKLSFFLLGLATSIKIYPILIFPYYLLVVVKNDGVKKVILPTICYLLGLLSVVGVYALLSSGVKDLVLPLTINSVKPVHIESVWGSLLTIYSKLVNGYYAPGLGANGIFGIHPTFIYLPLSFYNYFWLLPLTLLYLLSFKIIHRNKLSIEFIFLVVLGFEIFSKILTGQYLYWFLTLVPLLNLRKTQKLVFTLLALLAVLITQYIYPLHYNELLGAFYNNGSMPFYFYLLLVRNLILFALFIQISYVTFIKKDA